MVLDKDVYYTITNYADKTSFDIIGFKAIHSSYGPNILTNKIRENYFSQQAFDRVLLQPELGYYPIKPDESLTTYGFYNSFFWTKCGKIKIYQKALNKLGEEKYSRYMVVLEDIVATCFLYNTAESMNI